MMIYPLIETKKSRMKHCIDYAKSVGWEAQDSGLQWYIYDNKGKLVGHSRTERKAWKKAITDRLTGKA